MTDRIETVRLTGLGAAIKAGGQSSAETRMMPGIYPHSLRLGLGVRQFRLGEKRDRACDTFWILNSKSS
ncbi:MAG TPA: hypothetical protein VKR06_05450 [Ktedonosporobacter sp.]|nr:hypothetical protein [Ktedonosporobacter sp.]